MLTDKIDESTLLTNLYRTSIFEWYVVQFGFKNGYPKDMCLKEIGLHSNLPNIMLVAIKVHVILRRFVVSTWMRDNKELV